MQVTFVHVFWGVHLLDSFVEEVNLSIFSPIYSETGAIKSDKKG